MQTKLAKIQGSLASFILELKAWAIMSSLGVDISNIFSFTEPHLSWPERGQGERPEVDYKQKVTGLVQNFSRTLNIFLCIFLDSLKIFLKKYYQGSLSPFHMLPRSSQAGYRSNVAQNFHLADAQVTLPRSLGPKLQI